MATKYQFNIDELWAYYGKKTYEQKAIILINALEAMYYEARDKGTEKKPIDFIAEVMNFWKPDEKTYILEDYANEV